GAAFVAATTRQDLYSAATEATRELVGHQSSIRLYLSAEQGEQMSPVASAGPEEPISEPAPVLVASLPSWIAGEVVAHHAVEVRAPDAQLCAAFAIPQETHSAFVIPLFVADTLSGLVVVARPTGIPQALKHSLHALASQTELAVESAYLTEDLHRRQSEARFSSLVQNSSDVVTVILADSTIRYQSPSIERVMGFTPEDVIGTRLIEYLAHPDDVPRIVALLAEFRGDQDRGPELVEFRWRHRDGTWLEVQSLWAAPS